MVRTALASDVESNYASNCGACEKGCDLFLNPDDAPHVWCVLWLCFWLRHCCKMVLLALRISKQLEVAKPRR